MDVINALPEITARFLSADQLLAMIQEADAFNCKEADGTPMLTILDFRNENFLLSDNPPPTIMSSCQTLFLRLDDIRKPEIRQRIPRESKVVTVTETGNRDIFGMRYLSSFAFSNIQALQFGMRGWLKLGYPTEKNSGQ